VYSINYLLNHAPGDECFVFGWLKVKVKASLLSVGPGANPGLHAVSPQVTISHPPNGRLPLLSARPAVTFPATEQHCR